MSDHSQFGSPSALYRHVACPGNVAYCKDLPEKPPTDYSLEGTRFHELMEKHGSHFLAHGCCKVEEIVEHTVYETLVQVKKLWDGFQKKHDNAKYYLELPVKLNRDIYGTADVVFYGTNKKTGRVDVMVIDYKYGKGVIVKAEENLQSIAYLLSAIKTLKIPSGPISKIVRGTLGRTFLMIAQVRVEDGWSTYEVKSLDTWGKKIKQIVRKVKSIYNQLANHDPKLNLLKHLHPGPHCKFCKADGVCIAQKNELYDSLLPTATELYPENIHDIIKCLTLDEQVEIFLKKSNIEDFLNAVAKNLTDALKSGIKHPAIKLIQTVGKRRWKSDDNSRLSIKELLIAVGGDQIYKQPEFINITDVEKKIGKGKLDKFTEKGEGKLHLVPVEDSRASIEFPAPEELPELTEEEIDEWYKGDLMEDERRGDLR